jgi:hypothetical protein
VRRANDRFLSVQRSPRRSALQSTTGSKGSPTAVQRIEKTSIQYSCLPDSGPALARLEIHDWYPTATSLHWLCHNCDWMTLVLSLASAASV